jgi:hypothetical protein
MGPINYNALISDPFAKAAQGVTLGAGMAEQEFVTQQRQQAQAQQQKLAQAQQQFFSKPNPTMRDALQFAAVLPKDHADALRPFIENFSKEQIQGTLRANTQMLSALELDPAAGVKMLRQYAEGQKNSGDTEEADLYSRIADAAENPKQGPGMAFKALTRVTTQIPGAKEMFEAADKAAATSRAEALAPANQEKAVAEAKTAVTTANFSKSTALAGLKLTNAQINNYAVMQDIARANQRVAAIEANIAREGNTLKRKELQLKVDEAESVRDEKVRVKYSESQKAQTTFDNTLSTIDQIFLNFGTTKDGKVDPSNFNDVVKNATGPIQSRIITTDSRVADFEEQIQTLQSQVFLAEVAKMRGLGALGEKEGAKLESSLASLSLRQSPPKIGANLIIIKDLMKKGRATAAEMYGNVRAELTAGGAAPTGGTAAPAPGMPAGFRIVR